MLKLIPLGSSGPSPRPRWASDLFRQLAVVPGAVCLDLALALPRGIDIRGYPNPLAGVGLVWLACGCGCTTAPAPLDAHFLPS